MEAEITALTEANFNSLLNSPFNILLSHLRADHFAFFKQFLECSPILRPTDVHLEIDVVLRVKLCNKAEYFYKFVFIFSNL